MTLSQKITAYGWPNSHRLANALAEILVTTDVGPRIVHFGFIGGENHLGPNPAHLGQTGGETWKDYGGHRLWHAPEAAPRTYAPDNDPVTVEAHGGFVRFIQATERATGIQKEIDVHLSSNAAHARLTHRLRNHNLWAVQIAPWALTVVARGGTAVLPLPPRRPWSPETFLPTSQLTLWAYTNLSDPRWTLGHKYILLRQDPARAEFQKIGLRTPEGWAAYARNGELFVKTFVYEPQAQYPDFNSPLEAFTNADVLELETLGPLEPLAPGASVEHVEHWHLFRGVATPHNDAEVEANVLPRVQSILEA
jgi:hypothetical protein